MLAWMVSGWLAPRSHWVPGEFHIVIGGVGARGPYASPELLPSRHGAFTAPFPDAPISLGLKVTSIPSLLLLPKSGIELQRCGRILPTYLFLCAVQLAGMTLFLLYPHPSQSTQHIPGI